MNCLPTEFQCDFDSNNDAIQEQYTIEDGDLGALAMGISDIIIEILWYPVHECVPGNEKPEEWGTLAGGKPEAVGNGYNLERPIPMPRSLTQLKQVISGKKLNEACCWAGNRVTTRM
jgi:hypothetical protein